MSSLLRMPAPAAGVTDALLLEWSVEQGGEFALSDVLAVIETDKAVLEIEAESAGMLHRRLVSAGQRVDVGAAIAVIGSAHDTPDDIAAMVSQAGAENSGSDTETGGDAELGHAPGSSPQSGETPSGDGQSVGTAAGPDATSANTATSASAVTAADAVTSAPGRADAPTALPDGAGGRIFASPIARRMAKEAGLTLSELTGTGPGGRIVRRDVHSAVTAREESATAAPSSPSQQQPARTRTAAGAARGYTDQPHSTIRAAIARRMSESKQTVPHFYLRATARVDNLLALRAELNASGGQKVSVNDLVIRAVGRAHRAVPEMNVSYTEAAIRAFHDVDVAVAIATDGGLVTPVIRDADRLSITDIATATADVAQRARHGRLRQAELDGGSITVSNLGMFGVADFDAIINPPQAAILAVGAVRREPVADGDDLIAASVVHLTLSVDHRPVDGVIAARWLAALVELLEHPVRILA